MRIDCQKVFNLVYMGVMVVGQVLILIGICKDDKDLTIAGASTMLVDNILFVGKLVGEGIYTQQPTEHHMEVPIIGTEIEMYDA